MENNDSNEVAYLLKDGKFTKVYVNQDSVSLCQGNKQPNYYLTVNRIQLLCYITILDSQDFQNMIYLHF